MTARDDVAALPGGAGSALAASAQGVYAADPGSITGLANAFNSAAGIAEGSHQAIGSAAGGLQSWTGPASDNFRAYMAQFTNAGHAGYNALTSGATALAEAATALSSGKTSLERAFEQVLAEYKANLSSNGHPSADEQSAAAHKAVTDNQGAVQSKIDAANAALGTAASAISKAAAAFSPTYSSLPAPSESAQATAPSGTATPAGFSHHMPQDGGPGGAGGGTGDGGGSGDGGSRGGLGPSGGPPSTQPTGDMRQWIDQAIQILEQDGIPASQLNADDIWTIIQHESSGNPNAINLWDSNAQAGHPSKGLMQTIDSTFQANALPGHGDIYNPVDNIIAGTRYALSRYGSIENVPGIVAVHNGGAYVGY
jgi:uncharacterized protein YukE